MPKERKLNLFSSAIAHTLFQFKLSRIQPIVSAPLF